MAPRFIRKLGRKLLTNRNTSTASDKLLAPHHDSPTRRGASLDIPSTGVSLERGRSGGPPPITTDLVSAPQPGRERDFEAQDIVTDKVQRDCENNRQLDPGEESVQIGSRSVSPDVTTTPLIQPAPNLPSFSIVAPGSDIRHGTFNNVAGNQTTNHYANPSMSLSLLSN
jgi:hypothetical protein